MRRLTPDDLDAILLLAERNRRHLRAYFALGKDGFDESFARKYFEAKCAAWAQGSEYGFGLYADGAIAGWISLHGLQLHEHGAELSFWIDAEREGQGLVTRAATALIEAAFADLGLREIEISCNVQNLRSRRVAERLGFLARGERQVLSALPGASFVQSVYVLTRTI